MVNLGGNRHNVTSPVGLTQVLVKLKLRHQQSYGATIGSPRDWRIMQAPTASTTLAANGESSSTATRILEPDYRFTLANERTFLAWQRTALALLAAAVGVVQFLPELAIPGLRHILGGVIGVLAMLTSAAGLRRWAQVDHAIRRELPLPRPSALVYLAVGLMAMGLVTVALALTATVGGK